MSSFYKHTLNLATLTTYETNGVYKFKTPVSEKLSIRESVVVPMTKLDILKMEETN